MHVAWKVLLPISFVLVVVVGGLVLRFPNGFVWDRWFGWPITLVLIGFLGVGMIRAISWSRRRTEELLA